jgi:hypothetical protein
LILSGEHHGEGQGPNHHDNEDERESLSHVPLLFNFLAKAARVEKVRGFRPNSPRPAILCKSYLTGAQKI